MHIYICIMVISGGEKPKRWSIFRLPLVLDLTACFWLCWLLPVNTLYCRIGPVMPAVVASWVSPYAQWKQSKISSARKMLLPSNFKEFYSSVFQKEWNFAENCAEEGSDWQLRNKRAIRNSSLSFLCNFGSILIIQQKQ